MLSMIDTLRRLPHAEWFRVGHAYVQQVDCYPMYSKAAALIKPDTILEIGAFDGLGLVSFIMGYEPHSVSWVDNQSYLPDSNQQCTENLEWLRAHGYLQFTIGTTAISRDDERLQQHYDLVHIDGDHSFEGCLTDMSWAYTVCTPRVMLVDDMTAPAWPDVRKAVKQFSALYGVAFTECATAMGWAVFDLAGCLPGEGIA